MPSYLVECIDPHTEQTSVQPIDAHTPEQARARAIEMGFIAGGVSGFKRATKATDEEVDAMYATIKRWVMVVVLCAFVVLAAKWSYERIKTANEREQRNARGIFLPGDTD